MAASQEPSRAAGLLSWPGGSPCRQALVVWGRRGWSRGGTGLAALLSLALAACSSSPVKPTGGGEPSDRTPGTASHSQQALPLPPPSGKDSEPPAGQKSGDPASSSTVWRTASAEEPAVATAIAFLKSLSEGTPRLELLTADLVRIIGRPWELPGDREKGYSSLAAESWLKRAGRGRTFAPPIGLVGTEWAILSGSAQQDSDPGHYYLLLRREGQNWQVDLLVLSSAEVPLTWPKRDQAASTPGADRGEQELAGAMLRCWLAALADRKALSPDDRSVLVAAGLSPALRQAWAAPFDSDKAHGYDFNRGQLQLKIAAMIQDLQQFHLHPLDPPRHWQIEGKGDKGAGRRWVLALEPAGPSGKWLIQRIQETP